MKITDLSILCKWDNLKNRQCIKYVFAPLYINIYTHTHTHIYIYIYIYINTQIQRKQVDRTRKIIYKTIVKTFFLKNGDFN